MMLPFLKQKTGCIDVKFIPIFVSSQGVGVILMGSGFRGREIFCIGAWVLEFGHKLNNNKQYLFLNKTIIVKFTGLGLYCLGTKRK